MLLSTQFYKFFNSDIFLELIYAVGEIMLCQQDRDYYGKFSALQPWWEQQHKFGINLAFNLVIFFYIRVG